MVRGVLPMLFDTEGKAGRAAGTVRGERGGGGEDVSETVYASENFSEKPKRGRPAAFALEDIESMVGNGFVNGWYSRRGRTNTMYAFLAQDALCEDNPTFAWLLGNASQRETIWRGDLSLRNQTLLTELGRFRHPELIEFAAEFVCRYRLRTTRAAAMLRRWRREWASSGLSWREIADEEAKRMGGMAAAAQ